MAIRGRPLAVLLLMAGCSMFAVQDTIAKYLGQAGYHPLQIVWARYTAHLLLALIVPFLYRGPAPWRSLRPKLQLARSVLIAMATLCAVVALKGIPLADAATIAMTNPLFVTLFAMLILGERVGWRRLTALGVGFGGVLLVLRPGLSEFDPMALVMLASAAISALYLVITRITSRIDHHEVSFFWTAIVGALATLPFMPFVFEAPATGWHLTLFIAIGFWGGIGHLLMIMAHRHAPAPVIAPFTYTQLIVAVFLGWLVYDRWPDALTWVGAAVLVGSGLYVWHREWLLARRARQAEAVTL
ncbi:MAG TPA: DMT family transporter [Geminicoccus sp.]|uniref:DMT family transporter n=1 Tax=Geminicoccus sp. TaxID=2024832 RepID=UPI002E2F27B7|nr:DMT family transporter [Geminicoccus sp.]HEX2524830.1 DMT family transporter [Geminicoccus sp.]